MKYEALFEPTKIRNLELKNRIFFAPICTNFIYDCDGHETDDIRFFMLARAKGGAGLLVDPSMYSVKEMALAAPAAEPYIYDLTHVRGMYLLTEGVHAFGAKIFAQFYLHQGKVRHRLDGKAPWAPSPIPAEPYPELWLRGEWKILQKHPISRKYAFPALMPQEMSIDEIRQACKESGEHAELAILAGYDGIDIHMCHGHLDEQFLSPRSNKRTDMYGGSLENRMRFKLEWAEAVLKVARELDPQIVVGVRLSAEEHVPGGFTLDDTKVLARELEGLGIDYLSVTDGSCWESTRFTLPDSHELMLHYAEEYKKILTIPVMCPAYDNPAQAEAAMKEGKVDIVGIGRALLADPLLPNKIREGRENEINKCTRCNFCWMGLRTSTVVRCPINPELGFEKYNPEYRPPPIKGIDVLPPILRRERALKARVEVEEAKLEEI